MKDIIVNNVQTVQVELHEAFKEIHSFAEKLIVKRFKEKEIKDTEIALAMQQLMNGVLTVSS